MFKKTISSIVLVCGLAGALVGCEPSAQEKLAQQQLDMQKAMLQEAKKMQEELKQLPPIGQEKMKIIDWSKKPEANSQGEQAGGPATPPPQSQKEAATPHFKPTNLANTTPYKIPKF